MKEEKVWEGVALICNTLKESEEYAIHQKTQNALAGDSERIEKINAFREAKYRQQNGMADGMHNTMEELFERQQILRSDPLCSQYLESEAKLCNIVRKAVEQIMEVVELEIPAAAKGEGTDDGQQEK